MIIEEKYLSKILELRKVFSDEACNRREVAKVRDLVFVSTDETLRDDEAYITAVLKNGERVEEHVEHAVGSLARPMGRGNWRRNSWIKVRRFWGGRNVNGLWKLVGSWRRLRIFRSC